MTDEMFLELKNEHIEYVRSFIKDTGNFGSMLTVIGEQKTDSKPSIVQIPIPKEFLEDAEAKDKFVEDIVPELFKDIKKMFTPVGVIWTSEAWMRRATEEQAQEVDSFQDLPITDEVLIITIDKPNFKEVILFVIKRNGKVVNSDGELQDDIELLKDDELSSALATSKIDGRFSNLFSKFEE